MANGAGARQFNLVAQLVLRGPANVDAVVNQINRRLQRIQGNVNIQIARNTHTQLRQLQTDLNGVNSALAITVNNARNAAAALQQMGTALRSSFNAVNRGGQQTRQAAQGVRAIGQSAEVAGDQMQEFGRISALAIRRFLAFSIPAGIFVGLVTGMKRGVSAAIEFEREITKVRQVTGSTSVGIRSLTSEVTSLAREFGVASSELADISRILSQAGLSARQVQTSLRALAKSDLAPTFDSMQQTAEGAIAMMRQFGIEAKSLESKLGSMNAVAGSFAVESGDLISAIRRTGGAFKAAGGNVEELMALFTSVRATTRESADSIATGFRTIFTRLQRPRTIKFLREFGVELQKTGGKFAGPMEAVRALNTELKKLDPRDVRFARIVEELGGFRQVSKVIPLIQQYTQAQKALAVAQAGTQSLTLDAIIASETLGKKIDATKEKFLDMFRVLAGSGTFKAMVHTALSFAGALADVTKNLEPLLPLLAMLGLTKGGLAIGGFIGGFGRGLMGIGTAMNQNTTVVAQNTASQQQQNTQMQGWVNALGTNNQNLSALTQAVRALDQAVRARAVVGATPAGRRGTYAGGFATGGLVPGVGSRDTVPATLTPGEFVIRKSSVKNIGAGNLAAMNKYASGGMVTPGKYAYAKSGASGLAEQIRQLMKTPARGRLIQELSPSLGSTRAKKFKTSGSGDLGMLSEQEFAKGVIGGDKSVKAKEVIAKINRGVSYQSTKKTEGAAAAGTVKAQFAPGPINVILDKTTPGSASYGGLFLQMGKSTKSSNMVQKGATVTPQASRLERSMQAFGIPSEQVARVFANKTSVLGRNKKYEMKRPSGASSARPGQLKTLFDMHFISDKARQAMHGRLAGGVEKAVESVVKGYAQPLGIQSTKITERAVNSNEMRSGVGNVFDLFIKHVAGQAAQDKGSSRWDITGGQKKLEDLFGKLKPSSRYDVKLKPTADSMQKGRSSLMEKAISTVIKNPSMLRLEHVGFGDYGGTQAKTFGRDVLPTPIKKAAGGGVTDTVPALLTPGEYVINRKSAQAIGYGNLTRMNKYATGGIVRESFRNDSIIAGTSTQTSRNRPGGQQLGNNASNFGAHSGSGMMTVFLLGSVAQSLAASFTEADSALQKAITTMIQFAFAVEGTRMVMGSIQTLFSKGGAAKRLFSSGFSNNWQSATAGITAGSTVGQAQGFASRGRSGAYSGVMPTAATTPAQRLAGRAGRSYSAYPRGMRSPLGRNVFLRGRAMGITSSHVAGAGLAAGGVALAYGGTRLSGYAQNQARENAYLSRSQVSDLQTAQGVGSTLTGAGTGLAIGAAIGSVVPVIGTAVGAAIGTAVGGLVGALGANTDEIRSLNREARFEKSSEKIGQAIGELTSGRSNIIGGDLNKFGRELDKQVRVISEAGLEGKNVEAAQRQKVLTGQLPQFEQLKQQLIGARDSLSAFKTVGGDAGETLIGVMANIRGVGIDKIEDEIRKEIDARVDAEKAARKETEGRRELIATTDVLRKFDAALNDARVKAIAMSSSLDFAAGVAKGQFGGIKYSGKPGGGQFRLAATGRVFDMKQYEDALGQLFGGLQSGNRVKSEAIAMAGFIEELPTMLQNAATQGLLANKNIGDLIQEQFDKYTDKIEASSGKLAAASVTGVQNIVLGGVSKMMGGRGGEGVGEFMGLVREDPRALAQKLTGEKVTQYFSVLDSIHKQMAEQAQTQLGIVSKYTDIQRDIFTRQVKVYQQSQEAARQIGQLRDPIGYTFSPAQAAAEMASRRGIMLGGNQSGVSGLSSAEQIGDALLNVQEKILEAEKAYQGADYGREQLKALESLKKWQSEGNKLSAALRTFTDVTLQATTILKELNRLEEGKKAKFSILERYAFGSQKDKQKALRDIVNTTLISHGKFKLRDMHPDMRGGIQGMMNALPNQRTMMFNNQTGTQAKYGAVHADLAGVRLPPFLAKLFGATLGPSIDKNANITARNAEETALIDQLKQVYADRDTAQSKFIDGMTSVKDAFAKEIAGFGHVIHDFEIALFNEQRRKFEAEKADVVSEQEFIKARQEQRTQALGGVRGMGRVTGVADLSETFAKDFVTSLADKETRIGQVRARTKLVQEEMIPLTASEKSSIFKALEHGKSQDEVNNIARALAKTGFGETVREATFGQDELYNKILGDMAERFSHIEIMQPRQFAMDAMKRQYSHAGLLTTTPESINELFTEERDKFGQKVTVDPVRENLLEDILFGKYGNESYEALANFAIDKTSLAQLNDWAEQLTGDDTLEDLKDKSEQATRSLRGLVEVLNAIDIDIMDAKERKRKAKKNSGDVQEFKLGGFAPRGTDTVPAMLTPGEYVINRAATSRNRALLESINSGQVMYAQTGAYVDGRFRKRRPGDVDEERRKREEAARRLDAHPAYQDRGLPASRLRPEARAAYETKPLPEYRNRPEFRDAYQRDAGGRRIQKPQETQRVLRPSVIEATNRQFEKDHGKIGPAPYVRPEVQRIEAPTGRFAPNRKFHGTLSSGEYRRYDHKKGRANHRVLGYGPRMWTGTGPAPTQKPEAPKTRRPMQSFAEWQAERRGVPIEVIQTEMEIKEQKRKDRMRASRERRAGMPATTPAAPPAPLPVPTPPGVPAVAGVPPVDVLTPPHIPTRAEILAENKARYEADKAQKRAAYQADKDMLAAKYQAGKRSYADRHAGIGQQRLSDAERAANAASAARVAARRAGKNVVDDRPEFAEKRRKLAERDLARQKFLGLQSETPSASTLEFEEAAERNRKYIKARKRYPNASPEVLQRIVFGEDGFGIKPRGKSSAQDKATPFASMASRGTTGTGYLIPIKDGAIRASTLPGATITPKPKPKAHTGFRSRSPGTITDAYGASTPRSLPKESGILYSPDGRFKAVPAASGGYNVRGISGDVKGGTYGIQHGHDLESWAPKPITRQTASAGVPVIPNSSKGIPRRTPTSRGISSDTSVPITTPKKSVVSTLEAMAESMAREKESLASVDFVDLFPFSGGGKGTEAITREAYRKEKNRRSQLAYKKSSESMTGEAQAISTFLSEYSDKLGLPYTLRHIKERSQESAEKSAKKHGVDVADIQGAYAPYRNAFEYKKGRFFQKAGKPTAIHEYAHHLSDFYDAMENPRIQSIIKQASAVMLDNVRSGKFKQLGSDDYVKNEQEMFARIFEYGENPKSRAHVWRNEIVDEIKKTIRKKIPTFHSGGMVPGSGDTPAVLEGGEYVINKKITQALAKGGVVKHMAGGGGTSEADAVAGGGVYELKPSDELTSALSGFETATSDLGSKLEAITSSMQTINGVSEVLAQTSASFTGGGEMILEAMNLFNSAMGSFQTTVSEMPEEIQIAGIDTFNEAMSTQMNAFSGHVSDFGNHMQLMGGHVDKFGGFVSQFKEAMSTEMKISVNHTVAVNVSGNVETDSETIGQIALKAIGPELDKVKEQIRSGRVA